MDPFPSLGGGSRTGACPGEQHGCIGFRYRGERWRAAGRAAGGASALYRQQQLMHMQEVSHISGAGENGARARLSMLISLTFPCGLGQRSADARAGARFGDGGRSRPRVPGHER
ncbi:hypothetical protein Dac01nite_01460 [Demequina activiva]|uniref:Uncharacterized protein n=1 Tax=Demequina activiva TaxID=1582364 RepID=A0A919UFE3_9MICO|nr:hypothetical protein Dac01nite_01460 [Demequina activiva]